MLAPFPGMDPFLEDQEWQDFHSRVNLAISDALAMAIEPRYVVRVERRIYVEHASEVDEQVRWADVSVLWTGDKLPGSVAAATSSSGTSLLPVECLLPDPQERRETYLVIREVPSMEIVTVIETLSPANKRSSSDGREQYLQKRQEILQSPANLVELDLLRGGKQLPVIGMPPGNYYAIVSRAHRRPRADVYAWTMRQPLPTISIPLKKGDVEAPLELQQVFASVYERARYHLSLNYDAKLAVPVNANDATWLEEQLSKRPRVSGS